jgi:hypothetical protein
MSRLDSLSHLLAQLEIEEHRLREEAIADLLSFGVNPMGALLSLPSALII